MILQMTLYFRPKWSPQSSRRVVVPTMRQNPTAVRGYQERVAELLGATAAVGEDPSEWGKLQAAVSNALQEFTVMKLPKSSWITEETLEVVVQHRAAKKAFPKHESTGELKKKMQTMLLLDKLNMFDNAADEALKAAKKEDMGKVFKFANMCGGKGTVSGASLDDLTTFSKLQSRSDPVAPPPPGPTTWDALPLILDDELEVALMRLKRKRCPGPDGIPAEALQLLPDSAKKMLYSAVKQFWLTGEVAEELKASLIIPLVKKSPSTKPENNRGISLLNSSYKLLESVLLQRLRPIVDPALRPHQAAYRSARSTNDNVTAARLILEHRREFQLSTVVLSFDLKSAFDRIDRQWMLHSLRQFHVPEHLVSLVAALNVNTKSKVRHRSVTSDEFAVDSGVRQGGLLSPLLFIATLDRVMRRVMRVLAIFSPDFTDNVYSARDYVQDMEYADDLLVVCSPDMAQLLSCIMEIELAKVGLRVNPTKSAAMQLGLDRPLDILVSGETLPIVTSVKFLGTIVDIGCDQVKEIKHRMARAKACESRIGKTALYNKRFPPRSQNAHLLSHHPPDPAVRHLVSGSSRGGQAAPRRVRASDSAENVQRVEAG